MKPIQLDYMLARYYSSSLARFLAVDPAAESIVLENPQSWNRYTYALNNPLKFIDPDGKAPAKLDSALAEEMLRKADQQAAQEQAAAHHEQVRQEAFQAVAGPVCEAAPVVGESAGHATVALLAAAPLTEGATMPAAGVTGVVTVVADGVAALCEPTPEAVANLGADLVGMKIAHGTAQVLKNAPGIKPLIKAGAAEVTGEVAAAVVKPPLHQSLAAISP